MPNEQNNVPQNINILNQVANEYICHLLKLKLKFYFISFSDCVNLFELFTSRSVVRGNSADEIPEAVQGRGA